MILIGPFSIALPDSVAAEKEVYELAAYEVVGSDESLLRLPGSGYRIDGLEIEDFHLDDANRLLQRVPGVYIREEDGYGILGNISLRGVDTSRSAKLTLMEDGIPTAPAPYSAPAAYYMPTLSRMSSVEILKGTSQVRYGPHTTGGVINFISTPLIGKRAGQLRFSMGSDGDRQAHGWLSERISLGDGDFDILLEGNHRETDGFRKTFGSADAPLSRNGFRRDDGMLKLGWTSKDGQHRLEAKAGETDLEAHLSYLGLSAEDFAKKPYSRYAASRLDTLSSRHSREYLRYENKLGPDWRAGLTFYHNTFHRNWYKLNDILDVDLDGDGKVEGETGDPVKIGLSQALATEGPGLDALRGDRAAVLRIRANNRDYRVEGVELKLQGDLERGQWQHQPVLGVRTHTDSVRRFQWHDRIDQETNGEWNTPQKSPPGSDGNRQQKTRALALHLDDEMTNGPWLIRAGARFEWLDLEYRDYATDGSLQLLDKRKGERQAWSAGTAIAYYPNEETALFINAYRGFSMPSPRAALKEDIEEEISQSGELGIRIHKGNGRSFELVFFQSQYSNLIVIDNVGSGGVSDSLQTRTENVGEVISQGLEFHWSATLEPHNAWGLRIPLATSITWTNAELDGPSRSLDPESLFAGGEDGAKMPYIPEWTASLSIGLEAKKWTTGMSLAYRDATFSTATPTRSQINPVNGLPDARFGEIDRVLLVDWNAHYELNAHLSIFVTVHNVFDRVHLVSRHPHGARAGTPRQFSLGLNSTF